MKDCKKAYEKFIDETFSKEIENISNEIGSYINGRKKNELTPLTMCGVSLVSSQAYQSLKDCLDSAPCQTPENVVKMKNILTSIVELIEDFNNLYFSMVGHGYFLYLIEKEKK